MFKYSSLAASFTKEYILSIPKIVDSNRCWIPYQKSKSNGYIQVGINGKLLMLHRVVLSLWHNINYNDISVDTMHNQSCDRRCFNPEHIKPGSHLENMRDKIHHNSKKKICPKCDGRYSLSRSGRHKMKRRCNNCRRIKYETDKSNNV